MDNQGTLVTPSAVDNTAPSLQTLHNGFCLGEVTVLPAQGFIVLRGEHRHVSAKALEVLLQLAQQPDTTISTQDLLIAVWGDANAAKVNLTHAISELRHVLGDSKSCPVFIQTLPKRGYRLLLSPTALPAATFVPLVERRGRGAAAHAKHRSWLMSLFRGSRLFSVSVAFLVGVWLFIQVMAITFPLLNISATGMKLTLLLILIVFPAILLVTWVGDLRERKKRLALSDNPDKQRYWRRQLSIELVFLVLSFTAVSLLAHSVKRAIDADEAAQSAATLAPSEPIANAVAVLPFTLSAGSSIEDYLLDGIRQELLYSLTQLNQFPVLADRAMQAIAADASYSQLAAELRVEFLLEGQLSTEGQQLQLEVSVIQAASGVRLWSGRLSQSRQALPALQQALHRQVQNALALIIPASELSQPSAEYRITDNFAAFDAYMQAKQRLKKFDDIASLDSAEQLLLSALQADPDFAMASASLCKVHLDKYVLSRSVAEFELARQACQHAAGLQVNQAEVFAILGELYRISGQYSDALTRYEQALQLNPRWVDALTGKAMVFSAQGNKDGAEQQFKLAIELEPGYWQNYMLYGRFLYEAGRFAVAARHFARAAQLKPGSTDVLNSLAAAWFFSGQFAQAIDAWQQVVALSPLALSYSNLGTAYYFNADYTQAEQMYRQALANSGDDYTIWTNLADVLDVQAERQPEALGLYQKALVLAERNLLVDAQAPALLSQISRLQSELQLCDAALQTEQHISSASQTDFYLFYDLAIASFNCQRNDSGRGYINQAIRYGYPAQLVAADPKVPDTGQ